MTKINQHHKTISLQTFAYALQGIKTAFTEQFNFKIHTSFALLALAFAFLFHLSASEVLWIILAITLVFVSEMLNSALEYLGDALTQAQNPYIKKAKDVSAGAVLLTAAFSVIVALVIFLPKLRRLFS